jgi:hypothetical protein
VIVCHDAVVALPMSFKKTLSIVARTNPDGAAVRRPGLVPRTPMVMSADRIPISVDPNKVRAWTCRAQMKDAGRWGWSDADPDRNLAEDTTGREQRNCKQFSFHGR